MPFLIFIVIMLMLPVLFCGFSYICLYLFFVCYLCFHVGFLVFDVICMFSHVNFLCAFEWIFSCICFYLLLFAISCMLPLCVYVSDFLIMCLLLVVLPGVYVCACDSSVPSYLYLCVCLCICDLYIY